MTILAALTRGNIANYVHALFLVYILLIFVYILLNLLFSFGVRLPYSRWSDAMHDFLRDVCEPYLRIFRRFIPPIGMFDLSPMIAIIVLYFVADDRRQRDPRLMRTSASMVTQPAATSSPASLRAMASRAPAWSRRSWSGARSADQAARDRAGITRRRPAEVPARRSQLVHVQQQRRGVQVPLRRRGARARVHVRGARACCSAYFARHPTRPWLWLPTGPARRRRDRQPARPDRARRRDRLHQAARTGPRSTSPTCRSRSACSRCCGCWRASRRSGERLGGRDLRAGCPARTAAGTRLDRFLAGPLGSRARAQALIDAGHVRVDGRPRPKRHLVQRGEPIEVDDVADDARAAVAMPSAAGVSSRSPTRTSTCWWSTSPRGWSCTRPAATGRDARAGAGADGRPAARSRGARGSSTGSTATPRVCSSSPRTTTVHRTLKALLAARRLRREYLALVDGHPPARTGTIDAPIGRHRRERVLMSIDTDEPREARTHFEIERLLPRATLLRVVLDTGRTHQIRVHMAAIGHPVCGDPQYGTAGRYGLERQFLHAARLAFEHPVTGERDRRALAAARRSWRRWRVRQRPSSWRSALPEAARNRRRGGPSKAAPPYVANRATGGRGREVRPA